MDAVVTEDLKALLGEDGSISFDIVEGEEGTIGVITQERETEKSSETVIKIRSWFEDSGFSVETHSYKTKRENTGFFSKEARG